MHYPFSYGNSYADVANGTMNVPSMPTFNQTGTISVNANGQGNLILPSNPNIVYNNVLKIHTSATLHIQGTGSLSAVTGTQTIENFDFYVSGQKFPVFSAHYQKLSIPAFGINDFKFEGNHIASITLGINPSLSLNQNKFDIYPNPVKDILYMTSNEKDKVNKIIITDLTGKTMITIDSYNNEKNIAIPVHNLNKGIYFIKIISKENTTQTLKFIKE